jgi:hypothetical protein
MGKYKRKTKREYTHSQMDDLGPELEKEEYINVCLRCDCTFKAPTKFYRLCPKCRNGAHERDYMEYQLEVP